MSKNRIWRLNDRQFGVQRTRPVLQVGRILRHQHLATIPLCHMPCVCQTESYLILPGSMQTKYRLVSTTPVLFTQSILVCIHRHGTAVAGDLKYGRPDFEKSHVSSHSSGGTGCWSSTDLTFRKGRMFFVAPSLRAQTNNIRKKKTC